MSRSCGGRFVIFIIQGLSFMAISSAVPPLPAVILSAGYGTRMGAVGQVLPKPLWPLGEKPLLEFVLRQALAAGQSPLWVNLHHQAALLRSFLAALPCPVQISEEPTLLGSGGGIHQILSLAQQAGTLAPYVALANADQVVWWDQSPWPRWQEMMRTSSARAVLAGIMVNRQQGFNRLIIANGRLQDIRQDGSRLQIP